MTVEGVLDTDYYALYPFEKKSLKIGFSKYGEMIDGVTNVGLEYDGVDPFAPPTADVAKTRWINGWLINITYFYYQGGIYRTIWAGALFADTVKWGGPWLCVWSDTNDDDKEDFRDKGYPITATGDIDFSAGLSYGGRKTNGTAITEPMKIIYDGPRKFVAEVSTTIWDHMDTPEHEDDIPLVKVTITIIFNKVKKYVILLKDVKSLLPWKTGDKLRIQFSNRGEVDLGLGEHYETYAHFFVTFGNDTKYPGEGQLTVYNLHWETVQTTDLGSEEPWAAAGLDPTLDDTTPQPPPINATFDVAQVINPVLEKVFFAAFWPALSDWEMYGFPWWFTSLDADDPHGCDAIDYSPLLPNEPIPVPFYIGEWDFTLDNDKGEPHKRHWRGVTVYGIVDWHDADDEDYEEDGDRGDNLLDREVALWQLKEVFNPWDITRAVNPCKKNTKRFVKFDTVIAGDTWELGPFAPVDVEWDEYCTFTERVIVDGVLQERGVGYDVGGIVTLEDGRQYYTTITFNVAGYAKVLYSLYFVQEKIEWFTEKSKGDTVYLKHHPVIKVEAVLGKWEGEWYLIDFTWETKFCETSVTIEEGPPGYYEDWPWDEVKIIYKIWDGRYEWIVVGRDRKPDDPGARTPDVLGATSIASALKNKNFETWYTGLDRRGVYGKIPFVMAKLTPDGEKWENYIDDIGRSALKDDFCKYVPISSANIVTVGGPLANLLTDYFNEFTDAFFVRAARSEVPEYKDKLLALTCWSKNAYSASVSEGILTEGYAVIATYKDLNGTTGLIIWGLTAADTYWAAAWFHDHILNLVEPDLQCIKPGATAIVLRIVYEDCIPTIEVVEILGTISETGPTPVSDGEDWPEEQRPSHPDP